MRVPFQLLSLPAVTETTDMVESYMNSASLNGPHTICFSLEAIEACVFLVDKEAFLFN